jgi:hypothetical protein
MTEREEIERLRKLCAAAAEAIDNIPVNAYEYEQAAVWDRDQALIATLRAASLGEFYD